MKFGAVPIEHSMGSIVAHAINHKGLVLKKGEILRPDHLIALKEVGIKTIVVAELEADDVDENEAAMMLADAISGSNLIVEQPAMGRVNIFAEFHGVFTPDVALIDRINAIDERITLATVAPMASVASGEMVATVKLIPFSVPQNVLSAAIEAAAGETLAVAGFRPLRIGVISTLLPGFKPTVVTKTLNVLAERIAMTPARIVGEQRVAHDVAELAKAVTAITPASDIVIIFGASAITDRRDVIPAAVEQSGGHIVHFGMPVDPGNLLLLAKLANGIPVLGAPGCARSPQESGFDWVLKRLIAGIDVSSADIKRMGAGGLLIEQVKHPVLQIRPLLEIA